MTNIIQRAIELLAFLTKRPYIKTIDERDKTIGRLKDELKRLEYLKVTNSGLANKLNSLVFEHSELKKKVNL